MGMGVGVGGWLLVVDLYFCASAIGGWEGVERLSGLLVRVWALLRFNGWHVAVIGLI